MLETKPPPECIDQKQAKKNLYIIFLVVASLFTSTSYSLCHFLSLILGTALSPYPGDVIFEWPLILLRNFGSELHTHILLFRFFGFNMDSFVAHIFCHN